jgi:GTP-binding protein
VYLLYIHLQAAIRPPTFVFFVNDAKLFPETYRRYMEKQLRSDAGFAGTPIRLLWSNRRKTENDEGQFSSCLLYIYAAVMSACIY